MTPGSEPGAPAREACIRSSRWSDLPEVTRLRGATGVEVVGEQELRATPERGPGLLVVADEPATGVVGVLLGSYDGRRGWLHRLAVHPDRRRGGVATALVAEVERRLRERGARRVELLVLPGDAAGLASWQWRGCLPCPDVLCTKALDSPP